MTNVTDTDTAAPPAAEVVPLHPLAATADAAADPRDGVIEDLLRLLAASYDARRADQRSHATACRLLASVTRAMNTPAACHRAKRKAAARSLYDTTRQTLNDSVALYQAAEAEVPDIAEVRAIVTDRLRG